jgi:hypothetical protein
MKLNNLRPTQPTQVELLAQFIQGGGAKVAMPSALPEHFLISIARDLRMLEERSENDPEAGYLTAPIMLMLSLYMRGVTGTGELTIGENALHRSLHIYQWAVEREIITRLVGAGGLDDEKTLLSTLEATRMASD